MKNSAIFSIAIVACLNLLGCASPPQKYVAPSGVETCELNDNSADVDNGERPAVFVVDSINGVKITNALNTSTRVGFGFGVGMAPHLVARPVQANSVRLHIIGVHVFRAPIEEIAANALGRYRRVEGDLELTLSPGKVYQVTGKLDSDPASVWIEDWETKERVSEIIRSK